MKADKSKKNITSNMFLLFITCAVLLGALEMFLRIYEPFEFRVKGGKIVLPVYKKYVLSNDKTDKLDRVINHTKNSVGFRGEEPPRDYKNYLTILTVGGSTTECFHSTDGKTWTDILGKKLKSNFKNIWINNAGLDGQSTFGHILLMEDYTKVNKPKVVLFLVGSNDREAERNFNEYDKRMIYRSDSSNTLKGVFKKLTYHSEVFGTMLNFYRYFKARNTGLLHNVVDYETFPYLDIPEDIMEERVRQIKNVKYDLFKERLERLVRISRENGIKPVFITQPTLLGDAIDDITNVNLAKIKPHKWESNGKLIWEKLEHVNDVTRETGRENGVLVIDLSRELPKTSKYYYDFIHFSNDGNEKVAQIVYGTLCTYLEDNFNKYLINECASQ